MTVQIIIQGDHATDTVAEILQLAQMLQGASDMGEVPFDGPYETGPVVATDLEKGMARAEEMAKKGMEQARREAEAQTANIPTEPDEVVLFGESGVGKSFVAADTEVQGPPLPPEPIKLRGNDHRKAADKMIKEGKIDTELWPQLAKGQKKRVEEALAAAKETVSVGDDIVGEGGEDTSNTSDGLADTEDDEPLFPESAKTTDTVEPGATNEPTEITADSLRDLISETCRDEEGKDDPDKYAAVRAEMRLAIPDGQELKISNIPADKLTEIYYTVAAL